MLIFSAKWRPRSPKSSELKMVSEFCKDGFIFEFCVLEYKNVVINKQKLASKKSENEMVMAEFKMLDDDANIFKMVGPILAK